MSFSAGGVPAPLGGILSERAESAAASRSAADGGFGIVICCRQSGFLQVAFRPANSSLSLYGC